MACAMAIPEDLEFAFYCLESYMRPPLCVLYSAMKLIVA